MTSRLYDLVLDQDWKNVIEHVHRNPTDAYYQDEDTGETPLYLACQYSPPLPAIVALVKAAPSVVTLPQTRNRDTPLHIAAFYRLSIDVWRFLLQAADTNNHHNVLLESKWNTTPLDALCDGFRAVEGKEGRIPEDTQWEMIRILLLPRHVATDCASSTRDVLQVLARLGPKQCPSKVLRIAVQQYEKECNGREATSECTTIERLPPRSPRLLMDYLPAPRCVAVPKKNCFFLEQFLRLEASLLPLMRESATGRSPLHLALAVGHTWREGVDALCSVHSGAVEEKDPVSGLFPFQLAAVPNNNNTNNRGCSHTGRNELLEVETIFELLVTRSQVFVTLLSSKQ